MICKKDVPFKGMVRCKSVKNTIKAIQRQIIYVRVLKRLLKPRTCLLHI
jgi:hypothetical protein